jgi:hypothetical protein
MPNEVLKFLNPYYERWGRGRPSKAKIEKRNKAIEHDKKYSIKSLGFCNVLANQKPLDIINNNGSFKIKYIKRHETK